MYGKIWYDVDYLRRVVERLHVELQRLNVHVVAVSGTSGLVPAAALSAAYGIQVVYSRKYKENSHGSEVEGAHYLRESPYVIIDDFISSGATIKRIIGNLEVTQLDRYKKPVAIILYSPVSHEAEFEGIPIINLEVR